MSRDHHTTSSPCSAPPARRALATKSSTQGPSPLTEPPFVAALRVRVRITCPHGVRRTQGRAARQRTLHPRGRVPACIRMTPAGNTCLWLRLPKRCRADTDGVDVAGSCVGRFARDAAPYVSNWSLEFVNQLRYLNDVAPAYPDSWRRRTRPRTRWPSDHVRGTAPQG